MNTLKKIVFCILYSPLYATIFLESHCLSKMKLEEVTTRWIGFKRLENTLSNRIYLLSIPEFRSVVYYRYRISKLLFCWIFPGMSCLFLYTKEIGPGLLIQHGFATIVNAKKIGKNCRILQQVTVGYTEKGHPTIGDNVVICAGAKVIGNITIGNNVKIGANAVVCDDVPDNCVVAGIPAKIIKRF